MIKVLIFDYGGVLSAQASLRIFGSIYAPKFGKNSEDFNRLIVDAWSQARVNKISSKLFWDRLSNFLETDSKSLRRDFIDFFGFRKEVFELVKKLKKNGYGLGLLSNQIEDWLEEIIEDHGFNNVFDIIVTSYKSGIAKPDISIFEEIVKKLNVKPTECIYIDDMEKNIPPAKQLGMKTILFTGFDDLKKELASFSIDFD